MTDIVDELRNRQTGRILLSDPPQYEKDGLCQQAAGEITRLREENERLREALKQISKNEYGCPDAECIDCHCAWCAARRALGGEG